MAVKIVDIEYLRAQNSSAGQLLLAGQSNTLTFTQYVTVDNNGNVGIGTSSSNARLSVNGDVQVYGNLYATGSGLAYGAPGTIQFASPTKGFDGAPTQLFWDSGNVRIGIGTSFPVSTVHFNYTALESTSTYWSTIEPTVLDSFSCTKVRSAHYFVQVTDEDNSLYHTSQIMVVQDGVKAYKSEYNVVTSGDPLGMFDAVVSLGQLQLVFTAFSATNKTVKITRTSMTA